MPGLRIDFGILLADRVDRRHVTGDEFGQGHGDHRVTVLGRVLVAQRASNTCPDVTAAVHKPRVCWPAFG